MEVLCSLQGRYPHYRCGVHRGYVGTIRANDRRRRRGTRIHLDRKSSIYVRAFRAERAEGRQHRSCQSIDGRPSRRPSRHLEAYGADPRGSIRPYATARSACPTPHIHPTSCSPQWTPTAPDPSPPSLALAPTTRINGTRGLRALRTDTPAIRQLVDRSLGAPPCGAIVTGASEPWLLPKNIGGPPEIDADAVVARYEPVRTDQRWRDVEHELMHRYLRAMEPQSIEQLRHFATIIARAIFHARDRGMTPDPETLFSERFINDFVGFGLPGSTDRTRTNYRSAMRKAGQMLLRKPPRRRSIPEWERSRIAPPYTEADLIALWASVSSQTTELRRRFLECWLVLAVGAGLRTQEMRFVEAADITDLGDVMLITIRPPRARTVPLRHEFNNRLRSILNRYPSGVLIGPFRASQRDPMISVRSRLTMPAWAPTPTTERMRSTWILALLEEQIPLIRFLEYSGLERYRFEDAIPYMRDRRSDADADLRRAAGIHPSDFPAPPANGAAAPPPPGTHHRAPLRTTEGQTNP